MTLKNALKTLANKMEPSCFKEGTQNEEETRKESKESVVIDHRELMQAKIFLYQKKMHALKYMKRYANVLRCLHEDLYLTGENITIITDVAKIERLIKEKLEFCKTVEADYENGKKELEDRDGETTQENDKETSCIKLSANELDPALQPLFDISPEEVERHIELLDLHVKNTTDEIRQWNDKTEKLSTMFDVYKAKKPFFITRSSVLKRIIRDATKGDVYDWLPTQTRISEINLHDFIAKNLNQKTEDNLEEVRHDPEEMQHVPRKDQHTPEKEQHLPEKEQREKGQHLGEQVKQVHYVPEKMHQNQEKVQHEKGQHLAEKVQFDCEVVQHDEVQHVADHVADGVADCEGGDNMKSAADNFTDAREHLDKAEDDVKKVANTPEQPARQSNTRKSKFSFKKLIRK